MSRLRRPAGAALAVLLATGLAGCRGGSAPHAAPAPSTPAPVPTASTPAAAHPAAHKRPRAHPHPAPMRSTATATPYRSSTTAVTVSELGKSWHSGCPVGPSGLRNVSLTYWGFDGVAHQGTIVVSAVAADDVAAVFRTLYADRFPIRRMQPVAAYGGSDNASMAADNTSAFNCRYAVADGPKRWSEHAYGDAIDIDPLENPYRLDGKVLPPGGAPYMDRSNVRPGMIVAGGSVVQAFAAVGWPWGGRWSSTPDYQHFSRSGG